MIKSESERTCRKREKFIFCELKFNVFYAYSVIIYCIRKIVFDIAKFYEAIVKLLKRSEFLSTAFDINPHLFGGV